MDLQALQQQSINRIREDLDELSGDELLRLRALESEQEAPRATLIKAIDAKLAELGATAPAATQDNPPPATPNGAEDAAAESAVEAPAAPAWQAPDYCGPLDGSQALWRVANLKARA